MRTSSAWLLLSLLLLSAWTISPSADPSPDLFQSFFRPIEIDTQPDRILAADLNGDHADDAAILDAKAKVVTIFLNNGVGDLIKTSEIRTYGPPTGFDAGDLDGDGNLDLVLTSQVYDWVYFLFGQGNGTFAPPESIYAEREITVYLRDVENDGLLDLVFLSHFGPVEVRLGSAFKSKGFWDSDVYSVGIDAVSIAFADLNNDGHLDIATANNGGNNVAVLLGRGDGTFSASTRYPASNQPSGLVPADFDEDGFTDVVTTGKNVCILKGLGDGTFSPPETLATRDSRSPQAIDLNSDGHLDLLLSPGIVLLRGQGDGSFEPAAALPSLGGPEKVVTNLNGDNHPDVLVANLYPKGLTEHFGNSQGTFGDATSFRLDVRGRLLLEDINQDGNLDLFVSSYSHGQACGYCDDSTTVRLFLGTESWQFSLQGEFFGGPGAPRFLGAADLNKDGYLDLVNEGELLEYAQVTSILLGQEGGGYRLDSMFAGAGTCTAMEIIDLDLDGNLDIVFASYQGYVRVVLGDGTGHFGTHHDFPIGYGALDLGVGDLNGDGFPDLATSNYQSGTVSVLTNSGHGEFSQRKDFPSDYWPISITLGDADKNGNNDIIVGSNTGIITVFLAETDSSFVPAHRYPDNGCCLSQIEIADTDYDGLADLAAIGNGVLFILRGSGDGTFERRVGYGIELHSNFVLRDLNEDGLIDIGTYDDSSVSRLLHRADVVPVRNLGIQISRLGGIAKLHWSDLDNGASGSSFHVFRESNGSERERLTRRPLSGHAEYDFVDSYPPASGANYWIAESNRLGAMTWFGPAILPPLVITPPLRLFPNHPNPFGTMTSISFSLGVPGHVRLAIFDVMGREVAELLETDVIGGPHQITWNGKDHFGRLVGRGNYFLKLESGREIRTQKITKWN